MVIIALSQLIEEKISLLKELMNYKNNRQQVNSAYQIQIDAIRSIDDYDLQKVESIILQRKELLIISKDIQETERLLAEIDALEWLQAQLVVFTLGNSEAVEFRYYPYFRCSLCCKQLKFDKLSEHSLACWQCMVLNIDS